MLCKNCKVNFEGNFCYNCGQKADTHRLNIKHFVHEAVHTFTHLDTGILYLIKELFIQPGLVALDYVQGARKKYYPPLQFLILAVAAATFLTANLHLTGGTESLIEGQSDKMVEYSRQLGEFFTKYFNFILFLGVPVNAFFTYLFFRSSKFNYSENLILNTFLTGQHCIMYIVLSPLLYYFKNYYNYITGFYFLLSSAYFIYGAFQFFKPKNTAGAIVKLSIIMVLHVLINTILATIIFVLFIYKR